MGKGLCKSADIYQHHEKNPPDCRSVDRSSIKPVLTSGNDRIISPLHVLQLIHRLVVASRHDSRPAAGGRIPGRGCQPAAVVLVEGDFASVFSDEDNTYR